MLGQKNAVIGLFQLFWLKMLLIGIVLCEYLCIRLVVFDNSLSMPSWTVATHLPIVARTISAICKMPWQKKDAAGSS